MTVRKHLLWLLSVVTLLIVGGCASEDPNIVNPPPGEAAIRVRLFNMVPDQQARWLEMELGFQTPVVNPGTFSAAVESPGDSTHLTILAGGTQEYRTPIRARFIRQTINNVYAVAHPARPEAFDTILLSNATRSLTTLPVAQVRVVHLVPDSTIRFDVRLGCPSGNSILPAPLSFRSASLYREIPPGVTVFSVLKTTSAGVEIVGTFECTLAQYTPYSIVLYPKAGSSEAQIMLFDESDLTANATRSFSPVLERSSLIRIANLTQQSLDFDVVRTSQMLERNILPGVLTTYHSVPTCETSKADVLRATLQDGRQALDSTSLEVRGQYTMVMANDAEQRPTMIVVPPQPVVYNTAGYATLRVVGASARRGGVSVSLGGRTSARSANGYTSGQTIASAIGFDQVSDVAVLEPGEIPLTISSTTPPASILSIRRCQLQADHSYLLIVSDQEGAVDGVGVALLDVTNQPGQLPEVERAALLRFVNGSSRESSVITSIGDAVVNGTVFYRNSITTCVPYGDVRISAGATSQTFGTTEGQRNLVVHAENGGTRTQFGITDDPFVADLRYSYRRVINATNDVALVSVAYDTTFKNDPDSPTIPHVARRVAFGTSSPPHKLDRVIRGSMYVYNHDTKEQLFSLPIDLGPLGNNYSLIVVGTKSRGYEVTVLQEF